MRQCHSKDREAQSRINKGEIEAVRRGSMMVNNEIKRTFMYPPLKHMHTHEHTNICVRIQNDCCGSWRRSGFKNVGRDVKLLLYASIDSSLIHLWTSRLSISHFVGKFEAKCDRKKKRLQGTMFDKVIKIYISLVAQSCDEIMLCVAEKEVENDASGTDKEFTKTFVCPRVRLAPACWVNTHHLFLKCFCMKAKRNWELFINFLRKKAIR